MTEDIPGWPWRPDLCPADLHYGEYLLQSLIGPDDYYMPKVLHVGTGLHHHIGLLLGSKGFTVIGLTVSRAEVDAFQSLTNVPRDYLAYMRDIRDARYARIGDGPVDSMSLFHLGESPEPKPGMLTHREVIEHALTWSREIVFYTGSAAIDRVAPLIRDLLDEGKMKIAAEYKSLVAYQPTHA